MALTKETKIAKIEMVGDFKIVHMLNPIFFLSLFNLYFHYLYPKDSLFLIPKLNVVDLLDEPFDKNR